MLATLRGGDLAHELGFLDGAPCYATLVASSAAHVLLLERTRLESLIDSDPRLLYARDACNPAHHPPLQTPCRLRPAELTNYVVKQHGRY